MILLILMLSCTFKELRVREKGKRKDISKAIRNPDCEDSRAVLKRVDTYTALCKNENGLLPIEEAIEEKNLEAIKIFFDLLYFEYPKGVYQKIIDTKMLEIFQLIPKEQLNYGMLSRIKDNQDEELADDFLKRIKATELEKLVVCLQII